jgi:hypothetical protein
MKAQTNTYGVFRNRKGTGQDKRVRTTRLRREWMDGWDLVFSFFLVSSLYRSFFFFSRYFCAEVKGWRHILMCFLISKTPVHCTYFVSEEEESFSLLLCPFFLPYLLGIAPGAYCYCHLGIPSRFDPMLPLGVVSLSDHISDIAVSPRPATFGLRFESNFASPIVSHALPEILPWEPGSNCFSHGLSLT